MSVSSKPTSDQPARVWEQQPPVGFWNEVRTLNLPRTSPNWHPICVVHWMFCRRHWQGMAEYAWKGHKAPDSVCIMAHIHT